MMRRVVFLLALIIFFSFADWIPTSPLLDGHANHVAIKLANGNILVCGGDGSTTCQIYDVTTGTWSYTGSLNIGRQDFAALLLGDGRVLVIGGGYPYSAGHGTCELYDPNTHTWSMTDTLNAARAFAPAVMLNDGRVLVVGGLDIMNPVSSCEIFDPVTETWSITGQLPQPQSWHDICLLNDGRVLSVSGYRNFGSNFAGCYIFDPTSETWSTTGNLNHPRIYHKVVTKSSGKALVIGGCGGPGSDFKVECEEYDPSTGVWTDFDNISPGRWYHTCTYLNSTRDDNRIVLIGGSSASGTLSDCEITNYWTGLWEETDNLIPARSEHTATLLDNGNVLVTGGNPTSTDCQILIPPPIGIFEQKAENLSSELMVMPNPFREKTDIRCQITDDGSEPASPGGAGPGMSDDSIQIRIYDASGRVVKNFSDITPYALRHPLSWDGTDTSGQKLPAGIYFLELKIGNNTTTQKILLVR